MRMTGFRVERQPPLNLAHASDLSDFVVVCGPNGSGKTSLMNTLLSTFTSRNDPRQNCDIRLALTSELETEHWKKASVDTSIAHEMDLLRSFMQVPRRVDAMQSTVIRLDARRQVSQLPLSGSSPSWSYSNPLEEGYTGYYTASDFGDRYSQILDILRRIVRYQIEYQGKRAIQLELQGQSHMPLNAGDPFASIRRVFDVVLYPKKFPKELNLNSSELTFELNGSGFSSNILSAGEQEVLGIVLDLAFHNPTDSIIFIDEPELHLHPELLLRMIKALKLIGDRNQFFFFTHSPDLISLAMAHSLLLLRPASGGDNQVLNLRDCKQPLEKLRPEIGSNLGLLALKRKIVLIEGTPESIDMNVYQRLLKMREYDFLLKPCGSRRTLTSFSELVAGIIESTVLGVQFFALCDRDADLSNEQVNTLEQKSESKLKFLKRYHIENYFLDPALMAETLKVLKHDKSWSEQKIKESLEEIAYEKLSYAVHLRVSSKMRQAGEPDISIKLDSVKSQSEFLAKVLLKSTAELARYGQNLEAENVEALVSSTWTELEKSIPDGTWNTLFPGKQALAQFCSRVGSSPSDFKNVFLTIAEKENFACFSEIDGVFGRWNEL